MDKGFKTALPLTAVLALALTLGLPLMAQQAATPPAQQAQAPPAQTPASGAVIAEKIGFLNFRAALQATNEVSGAIAEVQEFVDGKNQESEQRINEITALQEEINAKTRSLNAETLAQMRDRLERLQTELKRFQEDTQREINRRRDEIFRTYGTKMQTVIDEYAQANGYSVIFLTDSQNFGYVDPQWELTDEVAEAYNQKHPAAAPAEPTAPDSTPPGASRP